ncbi:modification methylase HaeIII [Abditibacteriota bacterium]|nr:modification methylase HaeIII [Abditibacteriota bacterium]
MRVVSLFSGAGGLDLGFVNAGHKVVWANDNFSDAVETYKLNIGKHIICGDIESIPSEEIPNCDIVVGGFPCQGFSVANWNRTASDERNQLYLEMLRVVRDKKPRYFLAENVQGLLSIEKGEVIKMIVGDFEKAGYLVSVDLANAADYGVPQRRQRVFIVGTRDDVEPRAIMLPPATHRDPSKSGGAPLAPWMTVSRALDGIGEPHQETDLLNHVGTQHKLVFNKYVGNRRVDPNKPAPTVTGRGDHRGGVLVLPHPGGHRRMTVREVACVQSFPRDFVFYGCKTSAYRQIANAVPPVLAEAVAKVFPL